MGIAAMVLRVGIVAVMIAFSGIGASGAMWVVRGRIGQALIYGFGLAAHALLGLVCWRLG